MGLPDRAYPCYLGKDAINEVSGRVGIEGGLVVADAASDEVLQAPEVQEKASVQHGHPVQEAWKEIAPLGVGQSLRSWRGCQGVCESGAGWIRWAGTGS